jgi:uncharacterized protein
VVTKRRAAVERSRATAWITDRRGNQVDLAPIAPLLDRLEDQLHPTAIWLFGSRARGHASPWSDWDLFVIVPDDLDEQLLDPRTAWSLAREVGVRADVVLCLETDFRDARDTCNTLAYEVAHTGIPLHGR